MTMPDEMAVDEVRIEAYGTVTNPPELDDDPPATPTSKEQ